MVAVQPAGSTARPSIAGGAQVHPRHPVSRRHQCRRPGEDLLDVVTPTGRVGVIVVERVVVRTARRQVDGQPLRTFVRGAVHGGQHRSVEGGVEHVAGDEHRVGQALGQASQEITEVDRVEVAGRVRVETFPNSMACWRASSSRRHHSPDRRTPPGRTRRAPSRAPRRRRGRRRTSCSPARRRAAEHWSGLVGADHGLRHVETGHPRAALHHRQRRVVPAVTGHDLLARDEGLGVGSMARRAISTAASRQVSKPIRSSFSPPAWLSAEPSACCSSGIE